jgi:hypothetical protein
MKRDGSTLSNLLRNDEEEIVSEKDMGRDDAENESDGSPEHEFGPDLDAVGLVLEESYQTGAGGGHVPFSSCSSYAPFSRVRAR